MSVEGENCLGTKGARKIGSSDDQAICQREKVACDLIDGFIAHGAIDDPDGPVRAKFADVSGKRSGTGWIMRAIQNEIRDFAKQAPGVRAIEHL